MEYASTSHHRLLDPASSTGPSLALSIPLPTAISAFIIPQTHRRSANFFDLLEQLELWRYLDQLGGGGLDDPGGAWARARVPI